VFEQIEYSLNMGFYWQFLLQTVRVKIGPATEISGLRALPYRRDRAEHLPQICADCSTQKCKPHHGWTQMTRIFKFKMALIELFDPCKSVLSVYLWWGFSITGSPDL